MIMSVGRLSDQQVAVVLSAANAAPTPDGIRPWRFQCTSESIELYGEDGAEGLLACGGALFNLRLAVQDMGVSADVRLTPDPAHPGLLAVVRTENERLATTWERQLASAGMLRDGRPTDPVTPAAAMPELRRAAEMEQSWLAPLSGHDATAIQVPASALVVVVGSLHEDVRALLRAGQAIQRVVLTATTLGLRTVTVPEPVATEAGRTELRSLIGGALFPHAVLAINTL
jgi:hypothetical protein